MPSTPGLSFSHGEIQRIRQIHEHIWTKMANQTAQVSPDLSLQNIRILQNFGA